MYRRETRGRTRSSAYTQPQSAGGFKAAMLKQTAVCIAVLVALIALKTYDDPTVQVYKNAVIYTVSETTDVPSLWTRIKDFFASLHDGSLGTPDSGDPLTSMAAPVPGEVTSPFGMRLHPVEQVEKFHYGVDIAGPEGEKIKAACAGEVAEVGSDDTNGNYILLKHSDTIYTYYAHCEKTLPVQGDKVKAGQVIATMGSTGQTTGTHLHFEIREGDNSLDPQAFIRFGSAQPHPADASAQPSAQ